VDLGIKGIGIGGFFKVLKNNSAVFIVPEFNIPLDIAKPLLKLY